LIDLYCERTAAGLWAEPLNVTSNLAFVIVAWGLWRLGRDPRVPSPLAIRLAALCVFIAAGSAAFHMLATTWARVLDEGPITLFQVAFIWLYARRVLRLGLGVVVMLIAGLLGASLIARQLFAGLLNGSLPYFPALLLSLVFGIGHATSRRRARWALLAGAIVFMVAVYLRSIDNAVCASFPAGTHVFWHVLAAPVVYLSARALLMNVE
jgi:hypothetical protein